MSAIGNGKLYKCDKDGKILSDGIYVSASREYDDDEHICFYRNEDLPFDVKKLNLGNEKFEFIEFHADAISDGSRHQPIKCLFQSFDGYRIFAISAQGHTTFKYALKNS